MSTAADVIRKRMLMVRARAVRSADKLEGAMAKMTDWKEYYRAYPWAAAGLTAFLTYTLVPSRGRKNHTTSAAVSSANPGQSLTDTGATQSQPEASVATEATSFFSGLVGGLIADVVRTTALNWATREINSFVNNSSLDDLFKNFREESHDRPLQKPLK
jgi:hypothetical protein